MKKQVMVLIGVLILLVSLAVIIDLTNPSHFTLTKISDIYSNVTTNTLSPNTKSSNQTPYHQTPSPTLYFLDDKGNEIKVNSISKEPYTGTIFDVDVPNDIVLVRRHNLTIWSGNSDHDIKRIYSWYKDGSPINFLNMPFEGGSQNGDADGVADGTRDYSGNWNNGTVYNATWLSAGGYDGKGAYNFSGIGAYIQTGQTIECELNLSVSTWFKSQPTGNNRAFLEIESCSIFIIYYGSNNKLTVYPHTSAYPGYFSSANTYAEDEWHHVAMTTKQLNATHVETALYGDGVLDTAQNNTFTNPDGSAKDVVIGGRFNLGNLYNGTLDEFHIFNRTLSAQQVKALYELEYNRIVQDETAIGDTWYADVTLNDGTEDSADTLTSANISIVNILPTVAVVNITSADPDNYANGSLKGEHTWGDYENHSVTINWTMWYKDGAVQASLENLTIIPALSVSAGETWGYSASVYDGYNWSGWRNSSNLTIATNGPPSTETPWAGGHQPTIKSFTADPNLVSYWQFEKHDNTTNTAIDIMDRNNGTLTNSPTWTHDGRIGSGFVFDGVADFIDIGGSGFDLTQGTMSAWVYIYDKSSNQVVIGNTYSTIRKGMSVENTVRCNNWNGSHHGAHSTISDNTWTHVVCVFPGVGQSEIYVNGIKGTGSNAATVSGTAGTVFGMRTDQSNNPFNGSLDEVMIFNRSLNNSEIMAMYLDGVPNNDTANITTDQDLSTSSKLTTDPEQADIDIKRIYNWYRNGTSIAVVNMPFEAGSKNGTVGGVADGTRDYSGDWNNGTVGNATWNPTGGIDGKGCYDFDGVNDWIEINNEFSGNTAKLSVSLWTKFNVANGKREYIFGDHYGTDFGMKREADDNIYLHGPGSHLLGSYPTDTNWHHIVFVYDNTTDYAELFIDGVGKGNKGSLGNLTWTANEFDLGRLGQGTAYQPNKFNGSMDEFMIFNLTLTPEQIRVLYHLEYNRIVSNETTKHDSWYADITVNDGTMDSVLTTTSATITINNSIPTIEGLNVTSTDPLNYSNGTLLAWINYTDIDNDAWTTNHTKWFKSGVEQTSLENSSTVAAANVGQGEIWIMSASVYDGEHWSEWQNSSGITIPNFLPTHTIPFAAAHQPTIDLTKDESLVSYWQFEKHDNTTNTAIDTMDANNGTLENSPTWTQDGRIGSAYSFDGVDDYINIGDILNESSPWSMFGWAKCNLKPSSTSAVFHWSGYDSYLGTYQWGIPKWRINYYNASNTIVSAFSSNAEVTEEWTFIGIGYNGTHLLLYVNGVLDNSDVAEGTLLDYKSLRISDDGVKWDGSIDEVMFFNRSLSASEVMHIYLDGLPANASTNITTDQDLSASSNETVDPDQSDFDTKRIYNWYLNGTSLAVLNMPFEGGSKNGTTAGVADGVRDYSGFQNNGTVYNATWNSTGGIDGKGCYDFDGVGDYIGAGGDASVKPSTYTLTGWVKCNDCGGSINSAFAGWTTSSRPYVYYKFGTKALIHMGAANYRYFTASADMYDGNWHFITAIRPNNTQSGIDGAKMYVDGIELAVDSTVNTGAPSVFANFQIGANTVNDFNGSIDDVMLFNRVLTHDQIQALYKLEYNRITQNETRKSQNWSAEITINDGTTDSVTTLRTANITITNTIPTVETINISFTDEENRTNSTLVGHNDFSDIDVDDIWTTNHTKWYRNTTEQTSLENETRVSSGNIKKDDTWIFSARVYDNEHWSEAWVNSTAVTVLNTAPEVTTPNLYTDTAEEFYEDLDIVANTTYTDADSDTGNIHFQWWRNNSVELYYETKSNKANGTDVNASLPFSYFTGNQSIKVEVWSSDGEENSTHKNSSNITTLERPPPPPSLPEKGIGRAGLIYYGPGAYYGIIPRGDLVTLFDIIILYADSPITPGEFLDFSYFIKAMSTLSNDVTISYWLETIDEKQKVTEGNSVIYFGDYEGRISDSRLYIPEDLEGVYHLYVQAEFKEMKVKASAVVEVQKQAPPKINLVYVDKEFQQSDKDIQFSFFLSSNKDKVSIPIGVRTLLLNQNNEVVWQNTYNINLNKLQKFKERIQNLEYGDYKLKIIITQDQDEQDFTIRNIKVRPPRLETPKSEIAISLRFLISILVFIFSTAVLASLVVLLTPIIKEHKYRTISPLIKRPFFRRAGEISKTLNKKLLRIDKRLFRKFLTFKKDKKLSEISMTGEIDKRIHTINKSIHTKYKVDKIEKELAEAKDDVREDLKHIKKRKKRIK